MKTLNYLYTLLLLFACTATLSAQKITRQQADEIVINHIKNEVEQPCLLLINVNTPNAGDFVVTTNMEETIKAKYTCWVYYVQENTGDLIDPIPDSTQFRYLFVKENNGSLLEIITSNDLALKDLVSWEKVNIPTGLLVEPKENHQLLYPNPVDDWLTLPCNEEKISVAIYDLKGTCLFTDLLSSTETCLLNVSFLNTGTYIVNISGSIYKIIKN